MIYDCFTFFNELDLLEIRLNILDPYVDKFILVESIETFTGKNKPLYYAENKERFVKFNDKIIHIVMPHVETQIGFERHYACYDAIENKLNEIADPEDIAYCSDLDEIWKPKDIDDKIYSLRQLNYCYYLNNRSSEEWVGTVVSKVKNIKSNFNKLHRTKKENIVDDGGWHFTNMGGPDQIRKKLEAYDHMEFNDEYIKEDIEYRMENNEDFVGRSIDWQGKPFIFTVDDKDLPSYIINNKDKYVDYFKS